MELSIHVVMFLEMRGFIRKQGAFNHVSRVQ